LVPLDQWEIIRLRCVRDGEPVKVVARDLGLARNTVRKYVRSQQPPGTITVARPRLLDPYQSHIDQWLRSSPRITAKRIGTLLRERVDPELRIGERALRQYVAQRRILIRPKEAFVRAVYAPGDQVQFDFTPVQAIVAGVLMKLELFVMRLSYSGRLFARASRRCDQLALFTGLLEGLVAFGGLPREGVFDNAKIAVTRVLRGRNREENRVFRSFCGALALDIQFAAPAKGNEKGGVEGANGYIEDNVFRPIPHYASLGELNAALALFCERDQERLHSTHREPIADRFAREREELRPLPEALPRPCLVRYAHINKFAEVLFETNRYSVPTRYAHREAALEIFEDRLRVIVDGVAVAEHQRCFGRREYRLDIAHSLNLLTHKHRAVERAAVFTDERIPAVFSTWKARLFERNRAGAGKAWMRVMQLLQTSSLEIVAEALTRTLACGTDDPAAVELLVRQTLAPTPPAQPVLELQVSATAPTVDLAKYALTLLAERIA